MINFALAVDLLIAQVDALRCLLFATLTAGNVEIQIMGLHLVITTPSQMN